MPLSRFAARQPFTPLADFIVARPFDLNGETLTPGTEVQKDGLDERLLRNLYDQRKIEIVDLNAYRAQRAEEAAKAEAERKAKEEAEEAARKAQETAAGGSTAPVATDPAPKGPGRPRKAAAAPAEGEKKPMRYRVKQAGLGGFKVLDENGVPQGNGWPTHAEALAEAHRLNDL